MPKHPTLTVTVDAPALIRLVRQAATHVPDSWVCTGVHADDRQARFTFAPQEQANRYRWTFTQASGYPRSTTETFPTPELARADLIETYGEHLPRGTARIVDDATEKPVLTFSR